MKNIAAMAQNLIEKDPELIVNIGITKPYPDMYRAKLTNSDGDWLTDGNGAFLIGQGGNAEEALESLEAHCAR